MFYNIGPWSGAEQVIGWHTVMSDVLADQDPFS
jgi:hypothetical protein